MTDNNDGGKPAPPPTRKLTVEVCDFRAHRSGSLYGFIDVAIPELHLRIRDATVHASHDHTRRWVSMPSKPQVADGNIRRDPDSGKALYTPVLEITHRGTREAFSARVIEALLAKFPRVFDSEAA